MSLSRLMEDYMKSLREFANIFFKNKFGVVGVAILSVFIFMAIFAPQISPYNPMDVKSIGIGKPFSPPAWIKIFNKDIPDDSVFGILGTDELGRDIFSQIVYGSRISLLVGFAASFTAVFIGTIIGLVAGYYGGIIDEVLMRFADILLIIPGLPLMIVLAAILGSSIRNIILVIGITSWPSIARIIRSQVLTVKEMKFVEFARAAGCGDNYIIFKHILPNVMPLVYVNAAINIANAILIEAGLSFLGLGDPNNISWGMMLFFAEQYQALLRLAWWYIFPPGICILLVVLSFIFIGHALDEILNPRLRLRR
ncbi:MAG: ABC transporter permease [archaeon YNP-LCB-003-016]|uniref:ABC transporter permease n=1 Tax=Candidatus Culexarchaeum yellowstonense TaxID=2928963 RepID=UPI0026EF2936|nr:ABC transporter permease [Candidatus Culexarchaeum yellowstonense]MCR6692273.1 ABC transporter permease [Candidatus Culexarchaeum yellowstonense]